MARADTHADGVLCQGVDVPRAGQLARARLWACQAVRRAVGRDNRISLQPAPQPRSSPLACSSPGLSWGMRAAGWGSLPLAWPQAQSPRPQAVIKSLESARLLNHYCLIQLRCFPDELRGCRSCWPLCRRRSFVLRGLGSAQDSVLGRGGQAVPSCSLSLVRRGMLSLEGVRVGCPGDGVAEPGDLGFRSEGRSASAQCFSMHPLARSNPVSRVGGAWAPGWQRGRL